MRREAEALSGKLLFKTKKYHHPRAPANESRLEIQSGPEISRFSFAGFYKQKRNHMKSVLRDLIPLSASFCFASGGRTCSRCSNLQASSRSPLLLPVIKQTATAKRFMHVDFGSLKNDPQQSCFFTLIMKSNIHEMDFPLPLTLFADVCVCWCTQSVFAQPC